MLSNIKKNVRIMIYHIISMLVQVISFFIDIVIHPVKNISCILAGILYVILYKINIYRLSGKEMFLFSAGMVTILTFIVTFLQSVTVEASKKENYYLGYNLKRNIYDNFWIKRLHEMHIKLFLWIIFIIPFLRIISNYNYSYKVLNDFNCVLKKNEKSIYCIWVSIIAVVCLYCAAILIESINLTKTKLISSNFYNPKYEWEKRKIGKAVEKEYISYFKTVLNYNIVGLINNSYNQVSASELIEYIFSRARTLTDTQDEFNEYIEHVINAENNCLDNIYLKIDYFINLFHKDKHKNMIEINIFLLKKYLEEIRIYYLQKWRCIKQYSYYKYSFSAICRIINNDLTKLNRLENKFNSENKDIRKIYEDSFEGVFSSNKLFRKNDEKVKNVCISQIINVLTEMCKTPEMYEYLDFNNDIYVILSSLDRYYNLENYTSKVFDCIFEYSLKCENKDNNFINKFCNRLKSKHCDEFILTEAKKSSYNKIMSGDNISDSQLRWLLYLINDNDVIVALIFSMAYAKRSGKGYMSADTYRIWEERISELRYNNILSELNNDGYENELIKKIGESHVSHFIYPEFIKWLRKSLSVNFDSTMYQEFNKLRECGIRKDFDLCNYMILRSLLLNNKKIYYGLLFTKSDEEKIKKELQQIKEIIH